MDEKLKKIAHDVPAILAEGAKLTRKLAQDNVDLLAGKTAAETSLHIHKLAIRMHDRNLEPGLTIGEKVAMLTKLPTEKLAGVEAAIEMAAGGFKLASLRVDEDIQSTSSTPTQSPGEIGSSAHYSRLDEVVRSIG